MGQMVEVDEDLLRAAAHRLELAGNYYGSPGPANECYRLQGELLTPLRKQLFVGKRFAIMWRSTTEPDRGTVLWVGVENIVVKLDVVGDDTSVEGVALISRSAFG